MLSKFHSPQSLCYLADLYFPVTSTFRAPCSGCRENTCGLQYKTEHAKQLEESILSKYKIFGNPSEIRQELHAFENFPGSHTFFSEDFCDGFSATPLAYHSECGEMCLYEQDMLICLQNIVLCEVPVMNHPLLRAMLSICLKLHGSQLKTVGFISTTDNFLGHIHNEFLRKFKTKRILCAAHHIDSSPAERFSRFVKMLPVEDAKQEDFKTLGLIFEDLQQKEGDNFNAVIANLECTCKKVMEGLEHVIHSWKCHDPTEELPISIRPCPTVRCFADGPTHYSVKEEIDAVEGRPFVGIITPISRTKFRAVPILMPDGKYFILATDMLFWLIFDLTFGLNVFARGDCSGTLKAFVKKIETTFKTDQESKYLEDMRTVRLLVKFACDHFANFANPAIEDYASLDLKTELANLNLDKTFPEIMGYADKLPQEHCQASDLTVSINQCVIQCFLDEFPHLATFVHNQESCHQILVCNICGKHDSDSEEKPRRKKKLTKKRSKLSRNNDCRCVSTRKQLEAMKLKTEKSGTSSYRKCNMKDNELESSEHFIERVMASMRRMGMDEDELKVAEEEVRVRVNYYREA